MVVAIEVNGHHEVSELVEMYRSPKRSHVEMGRRFLAYRHQHRVSQQELGRCTGLTPGVIHQLESILSLAPELIAAVEVGKLTFKEARSIADLHRNGRPSAPDHERQVEIAQPFVSGRLASTYVERVVGYAKRKPEMPVDDVLANVLAGTRAAVKIKKVQPAFRAGLDLVALETSALAIAGTLDAVQLQVIPEYRRLKLVSTLRILEAHLHGAIEHLTGPAG